MTTYYVDGAVGNDANAGTSEGAGNAWATIDHAMNTVAAGDIVYVKATGTYSETPNIDTAGGAATPITFEGYTSTTGDNGKVTVTGTTNCLTSALTSNALYIFKNFIFTGASSIGVSMGNTDTITWVNCEFSNNGNVGINADNSHIFINCEALNNAGSGFQVDSTPKFLGCISGGNGVDNYVATGSELFYRCVAYAPAATGSGISSSSTSAGPVLGCTIDGDGGATSIGVEYSNENSPTIVDCIIYDNNEGVTFGSIPSVLGICCYNLMNSNTTDYEATPGITGFKDVSGAPAFTDEAGDDYTLGASSPAIDAGINPGGIT